MLTAYRELGAEHDFLKLWTGMTISQLGNSLTWLALLWFVLQSTGSTVAMGAMVLAYQLPGVLTGLFAGLVLDRFDQQRAVIADNLLRGLLILLPPLLFALNRLQLWELFVIAVISGALSPVTMAAVPVLTRRLVDPRRLHTANVLNGMQWQAASLVGPALAGVLVAVMGPMNVLVLDGLSFFTCAVFVAWAAGAAGRQEGGQGARGGGVAGRAGGGREQRAGSERKEQHALGTIVKRFLLRLSVAFRFLARQPAVAAFMLYDFGWYFFYGPLETMLPLYSRDILHTGAYGVGLLWSIFSVGAVATSLVIGSRSWPWPTGLSMLAMTLAWGLFVTPLAWIHQLLPAAVLFGLLGISFAPYGPVSSAVWQTQVPSAKQGRVTGLALGLIRAGTPLGAALGGLVQPTLGTTTTILAAGLATILIAFAGALYRPFWQLDARPVAPDEG